MPYACSSAVATYAETEAARPSLTAFFAAATALSGRLTVIFVVIPESYRVSRANAVPPKWIGRDDRTLPFNTGNRCLGGRTSGACG